MVAANMKSDKSLYIRELAADLEFWPRESRLGWPVVDSVENSKNFNKMHIDASG